MNSKFKFPKTISSCCATKYKKSVPHHNHHLRVLYVVRCVSVTDRSMYTQFAGKNKFDHLPPTVLYISMYILVYIYIEFINGWVQVIVVVQRIKSIRIRWASIRKFWPLQAVGYYKFANMLSSVWLWTVLLLTCTLGMIYYSYDMINSIKN